MTIEALGEQMITAMKAGNKFKKEVLSSTLSAAKNMAIEKKDVRITFQKKLLMLLFLKELYSNGISESFMDFGKDFTRQKI